MPKIDDKIPKEITPVEVVQKKNPLVEGIATISKKWSKLTLINLASGRNSSPRCDRNHTGACVHLQGAATKRQKGRETQGKETN